MNDLTNILKSKREELHLSVRKAASLIGISHTYLAILEAGVDSRNNKPAKPTPETLRLISAAYKLPYEKLMIAAGYMEDDIFDAEVERLDEASPEEKADFLREEFVRALIRMGKIKDESELTPVSAMRFLTEMFESETK